jgi:NAD(P) transhydrogenase subunit alpha
MVASMKPGSVIVDMAASNGGNVEGSVADELVVTDNGVKIIGYTDLAARLPTQASQLYGTNLVNLMKLLTPGKDGQLVLDFDDVVQRNMTVARDGELLWPPPAIQVSAAPVASAAASSQEVAKEPEPPKDPRRRYIGMGIGAAVFAAIAAMSPSSFLGHFTVFALAVVVGYYVIGHVHHALHTPLMSVTNAISGIIVVGALIQLGQWRTGLSGAVLVLAFLATLIASINIFGGFLVTRRMLTMFRKG